MKYIIVFILIISTDMYAQFRGGSGMGGGGGRRNRASSAGKSSDGGFEDAWSQRQHEIDAFDRNVVPLLKEKKVPEEKINELRQLPPYELGDKLKALGIDPNNIEVKDPKKK